MRTPRDALPSDFAQIVALNEESVQYLSPLTGERLSQLHSEAACHRVLESSGRVEAFLLAFREGTTYASPNYLWFTAHYPRFLYIDRVVVSRALQGRGLGRLLYEDLFAFARASRAGLVACEFDLDPPNLASRQFHAGFGFNEVGTHRVGPAQKLVSLQAVAVEH